MSFLNEKSTIEKYLIDNLSGVKITFANDELVNNSVKKWIRVTINSTGSAQVSLGTTPLYRYNGLISIQIFTEIDIGSGAAISIADDLSNLLRSKRVDSIQMLTPTIKQIGKTENWYQVNFFISFYREE